MSEQRRIVAVVDDEPTVLKATAWLLRSEGYVVETFESPKQFLSAAQTLHAACAVVDLRMPEMNGLQLQQALAGVESVTAIVFLSGNGDVRTSVLAMKNGAVDFLQKPVDSDELLGAIERAIKRHERAKSEKEEAHERDTIARRIKALCPRERDVCVRVAKGLLNKQIAAELGLAEVTVKVHRAKAMEHLGVSSAAELARLFERAGWRES